MKKTVLLLVLLTTLTMTTLTGCGSSFALDDSMKESITEAINEITIEIIDINGMAYFYADADYVQLVDADGNPISYENGKSHTLLIHDLEFSKDNDGYRFIIEDSETSVKWLYSNMITGYKMMYSLEYLYESDTDLILGENGLPKID